MVRWTASVPTSIFSSVVGSVGNNRTKATIFIRHLGRLNVEKKKESINITLNAFRPAG